MSGQNTDQRSLFEMAGLARRAEMPSGAPEMPARSSRSELTGFSAGEAQPKEVEPFEAVSPFASLPLREVCGFCGAEVCAPGYVIHDYDELGVFCDEGCGDKRFRLYLNDTGGEERGLDDVDQCPA